MQRWENDKNPNFGPSLDPRIFFFQGFYLNWLLESAASCYPIQFQGKLIDQTLKKWQKT